MLLGPDANLSIRIVKRDLVRINPILGLLSSESSRRSYRVTDGYIARVFLSRNVEIIFFQCFWIELSRFCIYPRR